LKIGPQVFKSSRNGTAWQPELVQPSSQGILHVGGNSADKHRSAL